MTSLSSRSCANCLSSRLFVGVAGALAHREEATAFYEINEQVERTERRIALRLGRDHEVTKAYMQVGVASLNINLLISRPDLEHQAVGDELERLVDAENAFLESSRASSGVNLATRAVYAEQRANLK